MLVWGLYCQTSLKTVNCHCLSHIFHKFHFKRTISEFQHISDSKLFRVNENLEDFSLYFGSPSPVDS